MRGDGGTGRIRKKVIKKHDIFLKSFIMTSQIMLRLGCGFSNEIRF